MAASKQTMIQIGKAIKAVKPEQRKMLNEYLKTGKINGESMKGNILLVQSKVQMHMRDIQYYLQYHTEYLHTLDDVKKWFKELYTKYSLAFHPDDDFKNYINGETKKRMFSPADAKVMNHKMHDAFIVCKLEGKNIYDVCMQVMKKVLSKKK